MLVSISRVVVFLLLVQFYCNAAADTRSDQLTIYVSIPPQKFLVEQIVGDIANVVTLTSSTESPETFEPEPAQLEALLNADIYLPVGLASEEKWIKVLREQSKGLLIVDCCYQWMTIKDHGHVHGHDEHHDPHIWTDPLLSLEIAGVVKENLIKLRPQFKDNFDSRFESLRKQTVELDTLINGLFADRKKNSFVVSHPAWGYFAERYGLRQIALEKEGREPGPREMAEKIRLLESLSIKTIFIHKQHRSLVAERIAEEINAELIYLDPLNEQHLDNLHKTAVLLKESFE